MLMKKIVIFVASLLFFTQVYADTIYYHPVNQSNEAIFNAVQTQLALPDILTGSFSQIRKIKLLTQPLVSSGTFVLSKKNGLIWKQDKPFTSSLIVTSMRVEQKMMDNPPTVITQKEQPIVFAFTNVFLSVFQGNTKQVEQYFNLYFSGDEKKWKIALKPKGSPFNKAIKDIELSGGRYITTIVVDETQENSMIINLSNISQRNE